MRMALEAKFRQNPTALAYLLQSQGRQLVYSTKADPFWGEGRGGDGQNKLGVLLMEVRQKLRDMPVAELLLREQGDRVSAAAATRPDFVETVLAAQGLPRLEERAGDEAQYDQPANLAPLVSAAQEVVSAATAGQVTLASGATGEEGGEVAAEGGAGTGFQQQGGGATNGGVYLFVNPVMAGQADMKARRARQVGGGDSGGAMADLSSVEHTAGAEVVVTKEGQ
jgi:hypothetical protein